MYESGCSTCKTRKCYYIGTVNGKINNGFLVLLGVQSTDSEQDVDYLVKKVTNLRIFSDENDKMNLS